MNPQSFNPDKLGPRSQLAYRAVMNAGVWGGEWHRWRDVVDLMLASGTDILPRSCSNILAGMVAMGQAEARGAWSRRHDAREIRFIDDSGADDDG